MKTYIALFRGINVGGKNSLPMKELVLIFENLGVRKARTYIQSGNAVFESAEKNLSQFSKRLKVQIKERRGFEPHVIIVGLGALKKAMANNPFPEADYSPWLFGVGAEQTRPREAQQPAKGK